MGVIQYSAMVNEVRGKVGGAVYQRMGQSLGVRGNRHYNPSGSQSAIFNRQIMCLGAQLWNSLTPTQRLAWGTNAAGYIVYNRYGVVIKLTGWQLAVRISKVAYLLFGSILQNSQPYFAIPQRVIIGCNMSVSTLSCIINYQFQKTVNVYNGVYITRYQPISNTIKWQKFIFLTSDSTTGYNSMNLYAKIIALLGRAPLPSETIWLTVKTFDTGHYQWVQETTFKVIQV
jgi:hypothetical protein